ncbi:hypothetical protein IE53DRAFT_362197 [Violaceomyces palustris]|uniref:Uncharacterized protein n=1 Tax=Violaceomyces palustris TaxID=1673888 RepID=A0ACD0NY19_9BASI|nr:hypothetical protein IE53DRAFT_362197 [Violaceomyces palustris]
MSSLAVPSSSQTQSSSNAASASSANKTKDLFNAALQARNPTNNYIAHLKIWEDAADEGNSAAPQRKARYLILAVQKDTGRVTINKAKRNANGSFSIGKDWDLNTLREVHVYEPDIFSITLSRPYKWQTQQPREQQLFLQSLIKVYRKYTQDPGPRCIGIDIPATIPTPPATASGERPGSASRTHSSSSVSTVRPQRIELPKISTNFQDRPVGGQMPRSPTSRGTMTPGEQDGFFDPRNRRPSDALPTPTRNLMHETNDMAGSHGGAAVVTPPAQAARSSNSSTTPQRPSHTPSASQSNRRLVVNESSPTTAPMINLPVDEDPTGMAETRSRTSRESQRSALSISPSKQQIKERSGSPSPSHEPPSRIYGRSSEERSRQNPSPLSKTVTLPPSSSSPSDSSARGFFSGGGLKPQASSDSLSAASAASGGGARARLSAVEPVRGGAAYERMLLAGTGLSGVAEAIDDDDNDDDPYGGAVLGGDEDHDIETSILNKKRATLGRPKIARLNSDERLASREKRAAATSNGNGSSAAILEDDDGDDDEDTTLLNVEEMLEGFEWKSTNVGIKSYGDSSLSLRSKGTADVIEARLLDELAALESANIHAIIESDDRVALVVEQMEQALLQLDMMDSMIAGFKAQLNARADDISHIESQNRGLQVQTSNQRLLAAEIENLINTINVDEAALHKLSAGRLESPEGIAELEVAAGSLYKSMLQARRDNDGSSGTAAGSDMAATTERLAEHEAYSTRFCKRVLDYLTVTFSVEAQKLLNDPSRSASLSPPVPVLKDHSPMEEVLGRYCGLLLYMKEASPQHFARLSAAYFASASEAYKAEMSKLFSIWKNQVRKCSEEDLLETSFVANQGGVGGSSVAAIRSGTIRRPLGRDKSSRGVRGKGEVSGAEAFQRLVSSIVPLIIKEQAFISDLLHINDNHVTFADYMDLEPYFRRRAAGVFASSTSGPLREMKNALDLIFGFLATEWQNFTDAALMKEKIQIFGILAGLDRAIVEAEEYNCDSLLKSLSKLHMRLASQLDRFVGEQIKGIEQTKLTVKKRKGVVHFIKVFPIIATASQVFVERVESQLVNAETLNIRTAVDNYYEQICRSMFDALQTISRVDGSHHYGGSGGMDEDKGQLNHHVILIENMHYFITEVTRNRNAALNALVKRADGILGDSLTAYVHFVLRRPLGKMMDFGDGIDSLLRSTPALEVSLHSAYSKSAMKRLVKEYTQKDVRKAVEALSKRVAKHFGEDEDGNPTSSSIVPSSGISSSNGGGGAEGERNNPESEEVLEKVWNSCRENFSKEVERLIRILRECYPDTSQAGQILEVSSADVNRLFASNPPGGRRR